MVKKSSILLFFLVLVMLQGSTLMAQSGRNESNEPEINYFNPETWILGYFNLDHLLSGVHNKWYFEGYDNYVPEQQAVDELKKLVDEKVSITIVMGTWCPDSRREFPRFMKILDAINYPIDKVIMLGVDSNKKAPVEGYDNLDIERVPTFIIMRNKKEEGRIIEYPLTSLEQDMVDILAGKN